MAAPRVLKAATYKRALVRWFTTYLARHPKRRGRHTVEVRTNVFLWTPSHRHTSVGRPKKLTIISSVRTLRCRLEDLPIGTYGEKIMKDLTNLMYWKCNKQLKTIDYLVYGCSELTKRRIYTKALKSNSISPLRNLYAIDRIGSGATTPSLSGPGSNGNEEVLRIPQSSSITGTSPSDC